MNTVYIFLIIAQNFCSDSKKFNWSHPSYVECVTNTYECLKVDSNMKSPKLECLK